MAETYKLDIDMLERNGTAACLMATRALIARIRELERDKADWLKANAPGGWIDDLRRASQTGSGEAAKLLAAKHTGMRVDYQGLFRQARDGLRREPALSEMLRQLQNHIQELGKRWYAGDTDVVDELLQLYCVEQDTRASLDGRS